MKYKVIKPKGVEITEKALKEQTDYIESVRRSNVKFVEDVEKLIQSNRKYFEVYKVYDFKVEDHDTSIYVRSGLSEKYSRLSYLDGIETFWRITRISGEDTRATAKAKLDNHLNELVMELKVVNSYLTDTVKKILFIR